MPRKPIELPAGVVRAFVKDMRAFRESKETKSPSSSTGRAGCGIHDVKEMFEAMKDHG
jgi:hypothetical protein